MGKKKDEAATLLVADQFDEMIKEMLEKEEMPEEKVIADLSKAIAEQGKAASDAVAKIAALQLEVKVLRDGADESEELQKAKKDLGELQAKFMILQQKQGDIPDITALEEENEDLKEKLKEKLNKDEAAKKISELEYEIGLLNKRLTRARSSGVPRGMSRG